jgi:hypothetical protein
MCPDISIIRVSSPFSEEDMAELKRVSEADRDERTFKGSVRRTEIFCQSLLEKAKLPPWGTAVRMDSDDNWTDDLPRAEDWPEDSTEILRPGESICHVLQVAKRRYGVDSQEWFAAGILDGIDLVRKAIASHDIADTAYRALDLGLLMKTAEFKFTWEKAAMSGKKMQQVWDKRRDYSIFAGFYAGLRGACSVL